MRLKLSFCLLLVAGLLFPLGANALSHTSSTDSADLMLKKDQLRVRKQEAREAIQAKKDEFKLRLQTLQDQKKRIIIERMDTKMASINKKATVRLSSVLEKIQSILNRIMSKANSPKNSPTFDSATASAQLAIDNAKDIVASQSAMIYVIHIASESAVKENVGSTVSELRLDLRDAHKAVVDAKQAVMNAVMESAKLRRSESNATGSAQ